MCSGGSRCPLSTRSGRRRASSCCRISAVPIRSATGSSPACSRIIWSASWRASRSRKWSTAGPDTERKLRGAMTDRRTFLSMMAGAAAASALLPAPATAQGYPSKPVKIIVPAQPGGGLDLTGRTVGAELGRALGQSFVIENVGGAGGSIAAMATKRAAPDGYTLMVGYVGTHGTNPAVRKLQYDAVHDFTPIAMVGGTPNILVVTPSVPASDLKGFVDYAKKNPAKLNWGTGGIGLLNHLALEQFRGAANLEGAVYVHYKGIGPAITD